LLQRAVVLRGAARPVRVRKEDGRGRVYNQARALAPGGGGAVRRGAQQ
jgi:hypothetical protein